MKYLSKGLVLLGFVVGIVCIAYPLVLWGIGQTVFPEQANGSILYGPDGKPVGSRLIAQPFTKDEYFQPRPSAVSYAAEASGPSNLSSSNYALRARVASMLGPIVKYQSGAKAGQPVAPDIDMWFQKDQYQGNPHIVAQWADAHNSLAQAWVKADPSHAKYVDAWAAGHPNETAQWSKDNPGTDKPVAADFAVIFFDDFSKTYPGQFPAAVEHKAADGKTVSAIEPVKEGTDIQSNFFDMWRQEHADAALQEVPGDMVMASGSGLDPHITLKNALFQLDRVAAAWAKNGNRTETDTRKEIEEVLQENATAPLGGLVGEKMVNVLEVNLELRRRYGST